MPSRLTLCLQRLGDPHETALSGFDDEWRECQKDLASNTLFPEPPQRLESRVVIPDTNRAERMWKRASEDAKEAYNKRPRK